MGKCPECLSGIVVMWTDPDRAEIERCDSCKVFASDAAAGAAVVKRLRAIEQVRRALRLKRSQ